MAPFDDAAPVYLAQGLYPIPVRGKSVPAKGTTGYDGSVTPDKVMRWLHEDALVRAQAGRGVGVDSIGLRHQLTLAIDIDQGYGGKGGVAQLAAYAERQHLPALPATWSSTARGDDNPSRQYIYRIGEDTTFKTKPCDSVELCCWHHRFTVVSPSIHPATGTMYTWYLPGEPGVPPTWGAPAAGIPTPAHFAELPAAWVLALRGGVANADKSVETVDVPALLASFPQGQPDGLVDYLIAKWSDEGQHVGHDEAKNALINCFMVGREGHPGVDQLYRVLVERYTAYLAVARPGAAKAEARSLVAACADIAQQKPITGPTTMGYANAADFLAGKKTRLDVPVGLDVTAPQDAEPADDATLAAFIATFTAGTGARFATNRQAWLREALIRRDSRERQLRYHTTAAIADVLKGRYSAEAAVALLTEEAARVGLADLDTVLRTCLSAALASLEGAA